MAGIPTPSFPNGAPDPIRDPGAYNRYSFELKNQALDKKKNEEAKAKAEADPLLSAYNSAVQKIGRVNHVQAVQNEFGSSNPPFDNRILSWRNTGLHTSAPGHFASQLTRGYMRQADTFWKTTGQKSPYALHFLYNPSVIDVDYQVTDSLLTADAQDADANSVSALISGMQRLSFSLLFDRTYEVVEQGNRLSAKDIKLYESGVYCDVGALERMVGIARTIGSSLGGSGPMLRVPLDLYFGNMGDKRKPLAFYGYIGGMNVSYTHFASNMTPMRATVGVTFVQLVKGTDGKTVQENTGTPADSGAVVTQ